VHNRARREFSEHDIRLLTSIGSLVAGALHQARLHRQLEARERAHEQFVEHVIGVQEAERRRLAADMHDGISQRLLSLAFHLDAAAEALFAQPQFAAEQLQRARELNDLTLDEARAAIFDLRPPVLDDLGLADGLASLARSVGAVQITVDADECPLPEHVEIALYRIAQEALQNVVKHSGARRAELVLASEPKAVRLRITDYGAGFDAAAAVTGLTAGDERSGYGLRSMTERAELVGGTLEVRSHLGQGTTVSAWVPVP
jgi:two-component system NarL family sensor kinase